MGGGGAGAGVFPLRRPDDPAPPPPRLSTPCLNRRHRKVLPTTPPPQSSLLLDDNRVSARGGDRAERYSQVPQVALSANLSQRSLGLLINPRPSSLPGSTPSLPASLSTLPVSASHLSSRVPPAVALRPLLSSRAPGRQETARRRSSRHTGTGWEGYNDGGPRLCNTKEQGTRTTRKDRPPPSPATGDKLRGKVEAFNGRPLSVL